VCLLGVFGLACTGWAAIVDVIGGYFDCLYGYGWDGGRGALCVGMYCGWRDLRWLMRISGVVKAWFVVVG